MTGTRILATAGEAIKAGDAVMVDGKGSIVRYRPSPYLTGSQVGLVSNALRIKRIFDTLADDINKLPWRWPK